MIGLPELPVIPFERERGTAPTLLHSVDPVRGLTGADLEAVRVWAGNDHRDTAE